MHGAVLARARAARVSTLVVAGAVMLCALGVGVALAVLGSPDASMSINNGAAAVSTSTVTINSNVTSATEMSFVPEFRQIDAGSTFACGIATDGSLWTWGNVNGKVYTRPVCLNSDTDWKSVSVGGEAAAIKGDAYRLYVWGANTTPTLVNTSPNTYSWKAVSCGAGHTLALRFDGAMYGWGNGTSGQLGNGTTNSLYWPTYISSGWSTVTAGFNHSAGIQTNGNLYTWGDNTYGQLGDSTLTRRPSPTFIGTGYADVSAGENFTIVGKTDGSWYSGGRGNWGQLGIGYQPYVQAFICSLGSDWSKIVAGGSQAVGLKKDGSAWAWGLSPAGPGTTTPWRIGTRNDWTGLFTGDRTSYGIAGGKSFAWGEGTYGCLGDGDTAAHQTDSLSPLEGWEPYVSARQYDLGSIQGTVTVTVRYRDAEGSVLSLSDSIFVDSVAPTGFMYVNMNQSATSSRTVSLYVMTTPANDAVDMSVDGGAWVPYSVNSTYTLPAGDGFKTVSVRLRDVAGNIGTVSDAIELDTTPPSGTMAVNNGAGVTGSRSTAINSSVTGATSMYVDTGMWKWVDTGGSHTLAIDRLGALWGWGYNASGQIGDGTESGDSYPATTSFRDQPTRVASSWKWKRAYSGATFSMAIRDDGALYGWGDNAYGQLGNGTKTNVNLPVRVLGDGTWTDVAPGPYHTAGIKSDGTLWAWGEGSNGQLGQGNYSQISTPTQIGTDANWVSVTTGAGTTFAVKADGTMWSCGNNYYGELGQGTESPVTRVMSMQQIGADTDWVKVASQGGHTLALKSDHTLWAWGKHPSWSYVLGSPDTVTSKVPIRIGTDSDWVDISVGANNSAAKKSDGTWWAWGEDSNGQLGNGANGASKTPEKLAAATGWEMLSFSSGTMVGLTPSGSLMGAGGVEALAAARTSGSIYGYIADVAPVGWFTYASTVPAVLPVDGVQSVRVVYADGVGNTLERTASINCSAGAVPSMTLNGGALRATSTYLRIDGTVHGASQIRSGRKWQSVDAGFGYTMLHVKDGPVQFVGNGQFGQRGDGLLTFRTTSFDVGGMNNVWSEYSGGETHSLAIAPDGSLWAWGYNTGGCVGVAGEQAARPVQLDGAHRYRFVFAGLHASFAIRDDGTLWSWGENTYGQLGDGTKTNHAALQQVGTDSDWAAVSNWGAHTIAEKTDGSLWGWGLNNSGQLGLGDLTERLVPTQVAAGTVWRDFEAGADHTVAVAADGSLWTWGANASGQLGDGTTTNRTVPTRVGLYSWRAVAAGIYDTLAIRSDGSLWAWGNNSAGQLGDNTGTNRTSPVRIGTRTDWENIDSGGTTEFGQTGRYHSVGSTADGRIFTWGWNGWGGIGDGTYTTRYVPTEIACSSAYPWAGSLSMDYPWASGETTIHACFTQSDGSPLWLSDHIYVVPPGPSISSLRPTFGSVAETDAPLISAKISVNAGARPATVEVSVDGTVVPSVYDSAITQSVRAVVSGLSDDTTHTAQVRVTDAAGSTAVASTSFLLEKGPKMAHWDAQSDCRTCHGATVPHTNSVCYAPTTDDEQRCMVCHMGIHATHAEDPYPRYYNCQCHYYSTAGTPNWSHRLNPATCRTCHTMFVNGQDPNPPETPRHSAEVPTCTPCHRHDLRFEHARRKTDAGVAYGCNTCHTSAVTRVQDAIIGKNTDCAACHDPIDHVAPHVSTIDAKCQECHSGNLDVEHVTKRGLDCEVCHSSSNSVVFAAIRDHRRDCAACHGSGGHPHAAADLSTVPNGSTCSNCHSMDLLTEHAKPTSSSSADPCKACHGANSDGPRYSFTTWNRTCVTGACHAGAAAPSAGHNWSAAPKVDYKTACTKCHWPNFTHYVRYQGDNCNIRGCHPSWPSITDWYMPKVVTAYGRYTSAASVNATSGALHRIHVNGSWIAKYLDQSRCESCHGAAGCSACHTAPTHASHGPAISTPETYMAAFGATNTGYLQVNTGNIRGDDVKISSGCSAPKCHVRSKAATAGFKPACTDCH